MLKVLYNWKTVIQEACLKAQGIDLKGENMRFLTIILSLFLFAQTVSASPLSGNAKTKRIPAGTKFA